MVLRKTVINLSTSSIGISRAPLIEALCHELVQPVKRVGPRLVKCTSDFLCNRTFKVMIRERFSRTKQATTDRLQNVVAGSYLLFMLFLDQYVIRAPMKLNIDVYDVRRPTWLTSVVDSTALLPTLNDFCTWTGRMGLRLVPHKHSANHFDARNPLHKC